MRVQPPIISNEPFQAHVLLLRSSCREWHTRLTQSLRVYSSGLAPFGGGGGFVTYVADVVPVVIDAGGGADWQVRHAPTGTNDDVTPETRLEDVHTSSYELRTYVLAHAKYVSSSDFPRAVMVGPRVQSAPRGAGGGGRGVFCVNSVSPECNYSAQSRQRGAQAAGLRAPEPIRPFNIST